MTIIADKVRPRLDSPDATKYCGPMGRRDNRRSMKMRRRISQKKLKARIKRKRASVPAKAPAAKPKKKASKE